jgi:hypothetical protein
MGTTVHNSLMRFTLRWNEIIVNQFAANFDFGPVTCPDQICPFSWSGEPRSFGKQNTGV